MSGMADVIAAHPGYNTLHSGDWTTAVIWHVHCEGLGCDWHEKLEGKDSAANAYAAHVAVELAKAGFGNVQEALLSAADEMPIETLLGADKASVWVRERAHSLDPKGRALVQAIHDRKAEG